MWPGVEPTKDYYSPEYVQKMRKIVNSAARRGIHTLLDMHQDVISENFCGEGKYPRKQKPLSHYAQIFTHKPSLVFFSGRHS
jgi:hypothetical protein